MQSDELKNTETLFVCIGDLAEQSLLALLKPTYWTINENSLECDGYWIPRKETESMAGCLKWIRQICEKSWATRPIINEFVRIVTAQHTDEIYKND